MSRCADPNDACRAGAAAAPAHRSVGSGPGRALGSAIALATYLHSEPTLDAAFILLGLGAALATLAAARLWPRTVAQPDV